MGAPSATTLFLIIVAVVIVVALAASRTFPFGSAQSTDAVKSAIPTLISSGAPETDPSSLEPTPSDVDNPSVGPITGDVPGPDATVPPGVPIITGLRIDALADTWGSLGLKCVSQVGGFIGGGGGFTLHCEGTDPGANAQYVGEAVYWRVDGVQSATVILASIDGGAVVGSTAVADRLFSPTAWLVGGDSARAFAQDNISSKNCPDGCHQALTGSDLSIEVGHNGFQSIYIAGSAKYAP